MSDWISVKDRLPTVKGLYRIKGDAGSINHEPFEEISPFILRQNNDGYFGSCFDWKRATHWKPLDAN